MKGWVMFVHTHLVNYALVGVALVGIFRVSQINTMPAWTAYAIYALLVAYLVLFLLEMLIIIERHRASVGEETECVRHQEFVVDAEISDFVPSPEFKADVEKAVAEAIRGLGERSKLPLNVNWFTVEPVGPLGPPMSGRKRKPLTLLKR
jgi:hypothetical protein